MGGKHGAENQRTWAGGCLDADLLVAYNLGRISTALLEQVAEHLANCDRCTAALESVQR